MDARIRFDESATYQELEGRIRSMSFVDPVKISSVDGHNVRTSVMAIFRLVSSERLRILTAGEAPKWDPGDVLIALVEPGQPSEAELVTGSSI